MGILEVRAEDGETNQQEWQGLVSPTPPKSRVDFAGTIITAVNSAPADGSLVPDECAWWYDSSTSAPKVMFKAKDHSGNVVVASLDLSPP